MGAIISQIIISELYFDKIFKEKKNKSYNLKEFSHENNTSQKYYSKLPCCNR